MPLSHKRARFSAASCAVVILSLASLPVINAATTCGAKVQAALKTFGGTGSGVSCCKPDAPECKLSLTGDCDDVYTTIAWCLGAGASKACTISYGPDPDEPCGAYSGPAGSTYGMSSYGSGYSVSLQSTAIQNALEANWVRLSTLSDAGLCCSAGGTSCHVGSVLKLSENPCNKGEYEFKCFGTLTHGLCTAYSNTLETSEIGQYYLVNFDPNLAPKPAAPSSSTPASSSAAPATPESSSESPAGSSTTPTGSSTALAGSSSTASASGSTPSGSLSSAPAASATGSASPSGSTSESGAVGAPGSSDADAAGPGSSKKSGTNIAAIVIPVILALLLLALGVWFIIWRRRRADRPLSGMSDNAVNPYPGSATGATRGSERTHWDESLSMSQPTMSSTPYMSPTYAPAQPSKYSRIQQRPMSPPLPAYSLYSEG